MQRARRQTLIRFAAAIAITIAIAAGIGADEATDRRAEGDAEHKQRLAQLQQLIGQWRGVGQPQRGSTKDGWIEEADWAWSFGKHGPALVAALPKTRFFQ